MGTTESWQMILITDFLFTLVYGRAFMPSQIEVLLLYNNHLTDGVSSICSLADINRKSVIKVIHLSIRIVWHTFR